MSRAFRIPASWSGKRLDVALAELCPDLSRARVQKLVRKGKLTVDGQRLLRTNRSVRGGESVRLDGAGAPPLEILHEDSDILVLVKPTGLLTHATQAGEPDTLARIADQQFGPLATGKGLERPGIVHRLDRATSGVMVLARTEDAMRDLVQQFRARSVRKRYYALVAIGTRASTEPLAQEFQITLPLESAAPGSDRQKTASPGHGKVAETSFRVLQRNGQFALLECDPLTGRRHQIRVHLFSQRIQILGDDLYRVPESPKPTLPVPRMALHAATLKFAHPRTQEDLRFESSLPPDLARLRDELFPD